MIRYCLPIVRTECGGVRDELIAQCDKYDYLEVWLDYLTDFSFEFLDEIISLYEEKLILLLRRQGLAAPSLPPSIRAQILRRAASSRVLIDLDISAQKEELDLIQNWQTEGLTPRLIVSYHNYEEVPSNLETTLADMEQYTPHIRKASCFCRREEDALFLLSLGLKLKREGKPSILLGMGEHGVATRVFGTLWGNEMIFAPYDPALASAPGQLSRPDLEAIFSRLPAQP